MTGRWSERRGSGKLVAAGSWLFGAPAPRDAPRIQRLRWIRRLYLRPLPLYLLIYVMAALAGVSPLFWAVLGVAVLLWLEGLLSLGMRIRREQKAAETQ